MVELNDRAQVLGLILSTSLLLLMLLLGALSLCEWWYIAQLPADPVSATGLGARIALAVLTGLVFILWMGGLGLAVGRTMFLRVIRQYRWRFGCALMVMLGVVFIAFQMLRLDQLHWGIADDQILVLGGAITGLVFFITVIGSIGLKAARQLDQKINTDGHG